MSNDETVNDQVAEEVTVDDDNSDKTDGVEPRVFTEDEVEAAAKEKFESFKANFIKTFNDDKVREGVEAQTAELQQKLSAAESALSEVSRKYEVATLAKKHGVREETLMASKLSGEDLEALALEIAAERASYSSNATSFLNSAVVKEEKEDWVTAVARQITGGN